MEVLNNGIKVPDRFAGEFNKIRTKDRDPDYREACVKDYVRAHKGEVMKLSDFGMAAYGSNTPGSATALIKKLMKKGRLTRSKVHNGERGVSYTYLWHDQRVVPQNESRNGPMTTRSLDLPEIDFSDEELKKIDKFVLKFTSDPTLEVGDIAGVVRFRNWLERKHRKQIKAREEKLNER